MTNETNITSADDPRLTAYALGELDASEAAAVEAFLASDEAARREVDEIRAFAGVLSGELADESAPALHDEQRAALDEAMEAARDGAALGDNGQAAGGGASGARRPAPMLRFGLPLLAAAALVVAVTWQANTGGLRGALAPADSASAPAATPAAGPLARSEGGQERQLDQLRQRGYVGPGKRASRDEQELASRARSLGDGVDESLAQELEALGYSGGGQADAPNEASGMAGLRLDETKTGRGVVAFDDRVDGSIVPAPQALVVGGGEPVVGRGEGASYGAAYGGVARSADAATLDAPAEPVPDALYDADDVLLNEASNVDTDAEAAEDPGLDTERLRQLAALGYVDTSVEVRAVGAGAAGGGKVAPRGAAPARPARVAGGGGGDFHRVDSKAPADEDLRRRAAERQVAEQLHVARRVAPQSAPGESYAAFVENEFVVLSPNNPLAALSTFGVDVDPASYANVRRFLHRNELPPPDAVRLEELVNAFRYDDPAPDGLDEPPFRAHVSISEAPWAPEHRLVRIGLKGREVERTARPSSNLVFLLDVSGSMSDADKLPLLVSSMKLLLRELDERDTISVVTYASGSQVVLPPTSASERAVIEAALDGLRADGSTHASAGIQLAYETAAQAFLPEGNNRVLLATDGDFNVGLTSDSDLLRMIQGKAKRKVFLTVLGFGTGNLKDSKAELLADNGNGQYAYIDSLDEAHRVLVEELTGTLLTIAKDVKLQVEFNPARVGAYRLLGYENRTLAARDFRDDAKDAGELGAGHSVVAYYEVVPAGVALPGNVTLKYQQLAEAAPAAERVESPELLTVNLRYKAPTGDVGHEFAVPVSDAGGAFAEASDDHRFGAAVAMFGMLLRGSAHAGAAGMADVIAWAEGARGDDDDGRRAEFVRLARTAQGLLGVR